MFDANLQLAQAHLTLVKQAYDEATSALQAEPSSDFRRERYENVKCSLYKAEEGVVLLTAAFLGTHPKGEQLKCS